MTRAEVTEAEVICQNVLGLLLQSTATQGRTGADLRTAVGDFLAHANALLAMDLYGEPVADIFAKAQFAGITVYQLEDVRTLADATVVKTAGAQRVRQALVQLSLAAEVAVVSRMTFASRDDVEALQARMVKGFTTASEEIADQLNGALYLSLTALFSALIAHLTATAQPLPRLLRYVFAANNTTLVIAYKLYADAGRGDEIRAENDIVHPAFAPLTGIALSA